MKRILYILLLVVTQPLYSQKTLSLEECKSLSLQNNKGLKQSQIEIDMATQSRKEAFSKYFPEVAAAALHFSATNAMLQTDISTSSIPIISSYLPSMVNLGVLDNGTLAGVSATQLLFGGGIVRNSNRMAALGVEIREIQHEKSSDEVALYTEQLYLQCVKLNSNIETINTAIKQVELLRSDVKSCVDAGVTNSNDLLRVELELSKLESSRLSLLNAERLSKLLLAQQIALSSDSFEVSNIIDKPIRDPRTYLVDFESAVLKDRDLRLVDQQIELSELERKIAQGERMPKLFIGGAYGYNNVMGKDNDYLVGMVNLSIPISGWWSGSHRVKRSQLKEQQMVTMYEDSAEKLVVRFNQLYLTLTERYNQIDVAKRMVAQSEENLRLNNQYYRAGRVTLVELLEAQSLHQQSQNSLTSAVADYHIALSNYLVGVSYNE